MSSVFVRFFNVERGLTRTMYCLTVDPGGVVREYLAGRTVIHTHPFTYLIVAFVLFGTSLRIFPGAFEGGGDTERAALLLVAFFLALGSRIVFWWIGMNYAEHLILNTYLFAHAALLLMPAVVLVSLVPDAGFIVAPIGLAVAVAYLTWGYSRTFRDRPVRTVVGALAAILIGIPLWFVTTVTIIRVVITIRG